MTDDGRYDLFAPWTQDQINSLNAYQLSGVCHPYTCGGGSRKDDRHLDGEGVLIATPDGWMCPYCDYRQEFAMTTAADWSWKRWRTPRPPREEGLA